MKENVRLGNMYKRLLRVYVTTSLILVIDCSLVLYWCNTFYKILA